MQNQNRSVTFLISLFLSLVLINDNTFAQTDFIISTYLLKDDNTYKSRTEYNEWMNTTTCYLGQTFIIQALKIQGYYSADVSTFEKNSDLNNYCQLFGAIGKLSKDDYKFDIRAYARLRKNEAQYIYYNVDSYNLSLKLGYDPNLMEIYMFGLTMSQDNYKEFEYIDNFTYRFYGRYQHFFESRISLSGEAGVGVKNYPNQNVLNYYGPTLGRGVGFRFSEDPVRSMIFSVSANVAKSLTDNTGMNVGFGGQWFVGDPIEAYSNGIYYYTENDLYDDPYAYENCYFSLYITRQFAIGF